jgi:hypothetical protein
MASENRRWFLKRLSQTLGAATAATLIAGNGMSTALAYQPRQDSADSDGNVLTQKQMQILRSVCETILPRTDTPSAADLDCHGFIDHQISQCYSVDAQQSLTRCLDDINEHSQANYKVQYNQLDTEKQQKILINIEQQQGFTQHQKEHFKFLKGLVVFGFFTSEVGATQVLAYQAVPGGYKGSIPVTPETKAWGSMNFY